MGAWCLQVLTVWLLVLLAMLLLLLKELLLLLLLLLLRCGRGRGRLLLLLLKELTRHVSARWHGHLAVRCIWPLRQAWVLRGLGEGTPVGKARHHRRCGQPRGWCAYHTTVWRCGWHELDGLLRDGLVPQEVVIPLGGEDGVDVG